MVLVSLQTPPLNVLWIRQEHVKSNKECSSEIPSERSTLEPKTVDCEVEARRWQQLFKYNHWRVKTSEWSLPSAVSWLHLWSGAGSCDRWVSCCLGSSCINEPVWPVDILQTLILMRTRRLFLSSLIQIHTVYTAEQRNVTVVFSTESHIQSYTSLWLFCVK